MEGHQPKIPRVIAGVAIHTLPLGPTEGFVLSRIDASASLSDIADLTSLELGEVVRIVDKLILLGAVEWADGAAHLPRMSQKSIGPPRPTPGRPSQLPPSNVSEVHSSRPPTDASAQRVAIRIVAPARALQMDASGAPAEAAPADLGASPAPPADTNVASKPAAPTKTMPNDGIEISLERRKRIDDLYFAIDLLDHYDVLGITRKATKAEVRSAYFELSKVFHPDTSFRKSVGTYRSKMEAIFKRLTEAYEALGKKKARDEYDAYLASIGETREVEEALSGEKEIPEELRAPAPPPPPTEPRLPTPPPPPLPSRSTPTEEGKRIARELLQKRLGGVRTTTSSATGGSSAGQEPAPPVERTKQDMVRDLTTSLKATATHTGGLDRVTRLLADAHHAEEQRDLASAVRAFRLALALAPERREIAEGHERLQKELAVSLAGQYETQAAYEEKHQKWGAAALSWAKVVDGRPNDTNALRRAAAALLEAKGDLHEARRFAQRAVELMPNDAASRLVLGRVFHAAGLGLNAKRELEVVRSLDPSNMLAQQLLKDIAQHG